jgi:hypothetical protein
VEWCKKAWSFVKPDIEPIGDALAPVVGRVIDVKFQELVQLLKVWRKAGGKPAKNQPEESLRSYWVKIETR